MKIVEYFSKLMKNGTGYSSKTFFMMNCLVLGNLMIIIAIIVVAVDLWCDSVVSTDLNGLSIWVGSAVGVLTAGGLTKAIGEKNESHNNIQNY